MKTFVCLFLLAACAAAAPTENKRDKRSGWDADWWPSSSGLLHSYSEPLISHSIIEEPAVVSVKRIVSVPRVVTVKKLVSDPEVVSVPRVVSHSIEPHYSASAAAGWW